MVDHDGWKRAPTLWNCEKPRDPVAAASVKYFLTNEAGLATHRRRVDDAAVCRCSDEILQAR